MGVEEDLGIAELRGAFLEYTLAAFASLPARQGIRVLDIGCGAGASMVELARRYDAEFVGIDIDEQVLAEARARIGESERMRVLRCGLLDNDFDDASFDLLWEEGVLHILDDASTFPECARLLRPGGHLVSAETLVWHEARAETFARAGFSLVERIDWEQGCWWTRYYGPLEERVDRLRADRGEVLGLGRYQAEVAAVKADIAATDCGHFVFRRSV